MGFGLHCTHPPSASQWRLHICNKLLSPTLQGKAKKKKKKRIFDSHNALTKVFLIFILFFKTSLGHKLRTISRLVEQAPMFIMYGL